MCIFFANSFKVMIVFIGWAMQTAMFMFIRRKWSEDEDTLKRLVRYFSDVEHRTQVSLKHETNNNSFT